MKFKYHFTSFSLHLLAMAFMLCDHLWGTFFYNYDWLTYVGRIAFPLFAFLLVEGFIHTSNRKKYMLRLFIFALISELPFNYMMAHTLFYPVHQNVLWSFILGIFLMSIYEKIKTIPGRPLKILCYIGITLLFYLLGFLAFVDYYGYGILMISLFYFTKAKNNFNKCIQLFGMYWINCEMMKGLVLSITFLGIPFEFHKQGLALLSLPFIWFYSGKQGPYNKTIKALYYWFYPLHMAILGIIYYLLS